MTDNDEPQAATDDEAAAEFQHPATVVQPRGTFPAYEVEEKTLVQFVGVDGQSHEVKGRKAKGGHVIEPTTAEENEVISRFGWPIAKEGKGIEPPDEPEEAEPASTEDAGQ